MTSEGWHDPRSVEAARAGIQTARRVLAVEIVRDGAIYRTACCGRTFVGWDSASLHITRDECAAEGEQ